jgi:phosphatidylserine decarboxylase precursor
VLVLALCAGYAAAQTSASQYGPATLELKRLVAANPEIKRLLLASIEQAKQVNPDPLTNPAQSLDQYYELVALAERGIPSNLIKAKPEASLLQRIDQSLCAFYFVVDQPLKELDGRGYFNNSLQYVEPYRSWLKTFVHSWGTFLDTPDSWKEEYLRMAQADESFGLKRGWYEDPSHWKTFNQFFARHLKSADQRPIASPAEASVVVSPVDGIPEGAWAIDSNSRVVEKTGIAVKTGTVKSVEQLIGEQSRYKQAFAGGTFTHVFLDVGDYHHYHFPIGGVVREVAIIPGQELTGGKITWDSRNKRYVFDPSSIGWQSLETRGCVILETDEFGLVALLPIGMSPVSSVTLDSTIKEGAVVHKGDRLGNFLFGGSDFVVVFQAGYKFTLDAPPNDSHKGYSRLLMGERLGQLRPLSKE